MLGSPAPGGLHLNEGQAWLKEFFANCKGCRVDFVAVHFYECDGTNESTAEASAVAMMKFLNDTYSNFNKPLWLTEFNCGDGAPSNPYRNQTAANHLRFMKVG
jgi:hypothetical protein